MKKKIIFVLLIISCECNGGLLKGLFDSALEVHKGIHNVASSVLFGTHPQDNRNKEPETPKETIIVIVKDQTNPQTQNGPQNYNPQENGLEQNGNWNNNNPNNFGHHNPPNYVNNNNRPQGNQGQHNRPGYGNHNNQNYNPDFGNGNQNNVGAPNVPNYGQNPNVPNQFNNGNQDNIEAPNLPNYGENPSGPNQNNNALPNPNEANQGQYTTQKVVEDNKTDRNDEPLFVPLNPNEYVYGGDKIKVEYPKRETEDKSKAAKEDDEEFPIDIRFKDD